MLVRTGAGAGAPREKGSGKRMSALRRFVTPLAILAAVILIFLENPFVAPPEAIVPGLTVAFWILAIVVAVTLFGDRKAPGATAIEIEGPAFSRFLLGNSRAGLFWLPIRLF